MDKLYQPANWLTFDQYKGYAAVVCVLFFAFFFVQIVDTYTFRIYGM